MFAWTALLVKKGLNDVPAGRKSRATPRLITIAAATNAMAARDVGRISDTNQVVRLLARANSIGNRPVRSSLRKVSPTRNTNAITRMKIVTKLPHNRSTGTSQMLAAGGAT